MHVRAALTALSAAVVAIALAGCGSAPADVSGPAGSAPTRAITGVVVQTDSQHPDGGTPVTGVSVGLYLQPVHAGGPIAADPPQPIATVTTDADGAFRFTGLRPGKRYFVFASGARGYSIGHWEQPGQHVRLSTCTDCVMPL
ncbi:MAG TPA: SpaA isopeptide-forming pilin-related protein [Gaiellales bacterium]|jgi:hypothetical protein